MKKYTQHSPYVIHNRYSVTKVCIEFDRISLITNQKISVTIYIAIIMDLLKNNDEYDAGHYNNINEFKYFVENIKNDGVPVEPLSKEELSHFIFSKKDIKNKYVRGPYYDPLLEKVISSTKLPYKAYIYPVIKDELSNTLPAYLALYETYSALDNKMRILISEKKLSSLHHPNLKSLKKKHQFPDKNKLRNYSNF